LPLNEYPEQRRFNFPLLKMVVGRDTDIIKTPNGTTLIVHTFTGIFEFFPEIKQFRVIQNTVNAIEIEYVPDTSFYPGITDKITELLLTKTGMNMQILWKKTDFIPASPSGKPQLVINNYVKNSRDTSGQHS